MRKIALLLLMLLLSAVLITGCTQTMNDPVMEDKPSEASETQEPVNTETEVAPETSEEATIFPVELVDMQGKKVVIEKAPETIVSLSPTNTEILFALGLGDKVIGVTEYCDFPEGAADKEKVGDFIGPNVELIASMNPDIIFAQGYMHEDAINQFEELGIQVVSTETGGYESAYEAIGLVGLATGTEVQAEEIIQNMKDRTQAIVDRLQGVEPVSAFYVVEYAEDLWTASEGTFIHDIIQYAGGRNIVSDTESPWTMYSLERLVEDNPQVILTTAHGGNVEEMKKDEVFMQTDAVRTEKVFILPDPNTINRNGPRLVDALEEVARMLHPDLFQ